MNGKSFWNFTFCIRNFLTNTQGATDDFNSHRCGLGSNDDFLIPHDHRSPEIPFFPLEVGEVGNVRILVFSSKIEQKRKSVFGSNYETA